MRVLHVLQEGFVCHADGIIASLNEKLLMVSKVCWVFFHIYQYKNEILVTV